jgi:hypothetical protein
MAFILIRSTSPKATSTASPAEEDRSKFRRSRSPWGGSAGQVDSVASPRGRLARRPFQQQEQQSRPHRVTSGAPAAAQAERNAARLVAFAQIAQKCWRKRWAHTGAKRHNN